MAETEKFIIEAENANERLDKYLLAQKSDLSRTQIQKVIKSGRVTVKGKKVAVHHFLKTGDIVEILPDTADGTDIDNNPIYAKASAAKKIKKLAAEKNKFGEKLFPKINIIEDNPDFFIIEKPAGLLVHPTDTSKSGTLIDWLIASYPELKKIGDDPNRPAIVHRLDKDVSGLMIIPKTQDSFDYFKQQFKSHTITKKYLALVEGPVAKNEGEINFPIGRSKNKPGLFAARPLNQDGKKAVTRFKVKQRFHDFTLLEVEILTGRTHQIRVHLLSYSNPVAGDKLYHPDLKPRHDPGRIFLHAADLQFTGPDGRPYHFQSRLPKVLKAFLNKLK